MARTIKLELTADVKGLQSGLKSAGKSLTDLASGAKRFSPALSAELAKSEAGFLRVGRAAHDTANKNGLLYDSTGRLHDSFGRVVSDTHAASLGLKTVSDEARYASEHADRMAASLETAGAGLSAFGLVAVGGATMAITKYAAFDKAMSSVRAATHESAENMELLRNAAIDAGADTAFSAEEAAQGIEELAKAGVSTADVLGGGLDGALSLAAAGALSVGDAAEISASAMTQFKLSGNQIPHLADLLAAGAGKAQGSVHDLGMALNQAGLVASSTGLTIEETTGGLAAFASAGLIGSDAGTSFKTMLQRLTPQSKEAQAQFDALGISAYDANGEFVGLANFAGQLQTKMADLTPEARNAAMSVMFGSDAVRASTELYNQGAEGIQKWIDQVNDSGYAAETASIMQDNLAGDIEKLGGAFDTVFIKSGSGANDALRMLVQAAESFVDVIGKIPAPVLATGTILTGVAGGAALLGGAAINVIPKIRDTKDALRDLAPAGTLAGDALRGLAGSSGKATAAMSRTERTMHRAASAGKVVGKAVGGVGVALAAAGFLAGFQDAARSVDEYTQAILRAKDAGSGPSPFNEDFFNIDFVGVDAVKSIEDAFAQIKDVRLDGGGFGDWLNDSVFNLTGYKSSIHAVEEALGQYDAAVAGLAANGNTEAAADAFRAAADAAESQGVGLDTVVESFPRYLDHLRSLASESEVALSNQELLDWALTGVAPSAIAAADGVGQLEGSLSGAGAQAEQFAETLDDILDSIFELGRETRTTIEAEDALTNSLKSLNESVSENGKKFTGNSEAALKNREALLGVANDMETLIGAQARGGASAGEIQSTMKSTYDAMMKATGGSEELVRSILSIPADVKVETWMSETAKEIAEGTAASIELIPGYTKVSIAVSEDGTAGQVQGKIDSVTGKTEYIFVTDDGTSVQVQAGIANIDGKKVPVFVSDDGTVYSTEGKIQGIKGKDVKIKANAVTEDAEEELNRTARDRKSKVIQTVQRNIKESISWLGGAGGAERGGRGGQTRGGYTGGLVGNLINGLASGGLVPGQVPLNSQGDNILATVGGKPFGLRSGEMVVNERATKKNYPLLKAINDGAVVMLPGLADGGTYTPATNLSVPPVRAVQQVASNQGTTISLGDIKVYGAGDPERAARAVEDRITTKLARAGVRIG